MAVSYSALFTALGELIQRNNQFYTLFGTIDTYIGQIEADFQAQAYDDKLGDIYTTRDSWKADVLSWCNTLKTLATGVLTDRATILEQLRLGDNSSTSVVLVALVQDMTGAQTVQRSTVTIGSVTDTLANTTSAGDLFLDKVLDGYNAPATNASANTAYNGVNSELALTSDNMFIECISDSEESGVDEGAEVWQWSGRPKKTDALNWQTPGSGTGPTITTLNAGTTSYLTNAEFEDFTSNSPDSWDVITGTTGTHILEESTGAQVYRGNAALKFVGDGSLAAIEINQDVLGTLIPRAKYLVAVWVKGDATFAAGNLLIAFEGTGYSAGSTEKITMDTAALAAATAYVMKSFYIIMPAEIPDNFRLSILLQGTPTNGAIVRFDGLAFGPVTFFNGISAAIVAGAAKFIKGDRYTFAITNNDAGVIQKFFRDAFLVQLPSAASPSIADTLATDS